MDSAALITAYENKTRAELAGADALMPGADRVAWSGAFGARVMAVKGLSGPAEESGGPALSGEDGVALRKALSALGFDPEAVFATLSRPVPDTDPEVIARRLRAQVEAVEPRAIVALDGEAAQDVASALGIRIPDFGQVVVGLGRRIVAVDGLEASLSDESRKAQVWQQLKVLTPAGPIW